jgi:hypothetical protein
VVDVTQTTRHAKAVKYVGGLMQAVRELNKTLYFSTATLTWSLKVKQKCGYVS